MAQIKPSKLTLASCFGSILGLKNDDEPEKTLVEDSSSDEEAPIPLYRNEGNIPSMAMGREEDVRLLKKPGQFVAYQKDGASQEYRYI